MKKKKKSIGPGFIQGMEEALAYTRGTLKLKETLKELPGPAPDWKASQIRDLRKVVYQMSQSEFAMLLNVKAPTVRSWEQGQKSPSGSASRLLEILAVDKTILKKLAAG